MKSRLSIEVSTRRVAKLMLAAIASILLSAAAAQATTFQVTTTADNGDNVNPTVGSLRKAIIDANVNPGPDDIVFQIPNSGVQTISPPSPLPVITGPVTIDGYTQNGASKNTLTDGDNAVLMIELDGTNAGANFFGIGLQLTGGSTTIRGLVINRFASYGIQIGVNSPGNNHIEGCFIGTDPTGTIALPNINAGIYLNKSNDNVIGGTAPEQRNVIWGANPNSPGSGYGISITGGQPNPISGTTILGNYLGTNAAGTAALVPGSTNSGISVDGATNTTIGGTTPGARNVISGNGTGITVLGSDQTLITGNYIGTDTTGTKAIGNKNHGIRLDQATNSLIGGSTPASRNIISGTQQGEGIGFGQTSTGNVVQGNYIGTDVTGNVALANSSGISTLFGGVPPGNNKIGGSAPGEGNVISGNKGLGVSLSSDSGGNVIQGNFIGTNAGGTSALPNGDLVQKTGGGIALTGSNNDVVGGTAAGARNVISGNANYGMLINNAANGLVQGNFIGVDVNGAPLGNSSRGIQIINSAHDWTIGGTTAGAANVIAFNGAPGITVFESSNAVHVFNIAIEGNALFANNSGAGPGIDLQDNGPTQNDAGDGDTGPNNLQNFPLLTTATSNGGSTSISGGLNSESNKPYHLEFFANPQCSASGYGEGQTFLGATDVTTNGNDALFNVTLPVTVPPGSVITATATDSTGNTSEFSPCMLLGGLPGGGALQFNTANFSVNENAGTATVTVDRVGGNSSAVSVHYAASAGTATAGADFNTVSGTLNWAAGDLSSKTFTVPIIDDTLNENNETITLALNNPTGGASLGSQKVSTLTIVDDDPQPALSISDTTVVEGNSGTTAANFTISLSAKSGKNVAVSYKTVPGGSATAGVDYTVINGNSVTFLPGQTSKTITVNVLGDTDPEPDETFFVNLFNQSEASLAKAQAVATIINDDGAAPAGTLQFSSPAYSVNENGGQATITVKRSGGNNGAVSVQYSTGAGTATAGSDYADAGGTLNWADGDTADKTFSVAVSDDSLNEGDETVNLSLSNPTGSAALGTASAVLTIVDDDPKPKISINDVTQAEGNSGPTNFDFEVTLSAASGQTVTVDYNTFTGTAISGADFQPASGTVTFNPGETKKQITVVVNGDTQDEPDETFQVGLTSVVNATWAKINGTGTIVNDDATGPATVHFAQTNYQVFEDLKAIQLTVTRSGDTSGASSVDYQTVDGTATQKNDFEYAAGTLNFAAGESSKTITVLINEDALVEGNEQFTVSLSNAVGAALSPQNTEIVSIVDDLPESTTNSIDDPQTFVYMHYHDFLNREPDPAGLAFWTSQITACGNDAACLANQRINVSAAFFQSIEFQETGYLRYLVQKESFGSMPKYAEFMRDLQEISRGVIVNSPGWQQTLKDNQQQFAAEWVKRPAFKATYDAMSNLDYVNALYANAGVLPDQAERDSLVNALDTASQDRAAILVQVAENAAFKQKENSAAFVLMQYFGYLRRDPDAAPDVDLSGYNFWVNKLNQFGGNYIDAEMIKAFITSFEYRGRFGQ